MIDNPGESKVSIVFFMLLTCTILVSVINRNLATTLKVRNDPDAKAVVDGIEIACTVFFSFELCARIFASSVDPVRLLLCDIYFWVDVLAILPNLIEWIDHAVDGNTQALPTYVRDPAALMRMLRILKLMRHYTDWRVLKVALKHVRRGSIEHPRSRQGQAVAHLACPSLMWLRSALPTSGGSADSGAGVRHAPRDPAAVGRAVDRRGR